MTAKEHKCTLCGKMFTYGPKGHITMEWCHECIAKPAPPPAYVERNGLLIPNQQAEAA